MRIGGKLIWGVDNKRIFEARRVVNDFEEKKGAIYFKDGLNLVAVAPEDVLTKAVREDLKKYKLEILEILFKRNMDKGNDLVN